MKRFILLILMIALGVTSAWADVRLNSSGIYEVTLNVSDSLVKEAVQGQVGSEISFLVLGEANEAIQTSSLALAPEALQTPSLTASLVASRDSLLTGEIVLLDASGSQSSDGSIALYEWDLDGDGIFDVSSTSDTWEHAYVDDGTVAAQVRVTDDLEQSALSEPISITILNRSPVARFDVALGSAEEQTPIQFRSLASDADGTIASWSYTFGDGTTATQSNPTHGYAAAGVYTVTLAVTDNDGAVSDVFSQEIEIHNAAPVARFLIQQSTLSVGQTLTIIDQSADPSLDGEIVHVAWDFGDGAFAAGGPSANGVYTHTFAGFGTYTITLYVIDNDGSMATAQSRVSVL
jgi:PKD repeat protein